jgi:hypothetical protein
MTWCWRRWGGFFSNSSPTETHRMTTGGPPISSRLRPRRGGYWPYPMSERWTHGHSLLGAAVRRLAARVTGLPACVICGRGHAQIDWVVDSFGRVHGRCEGCVDSVEARGPGAKVV